MADPQKIWSSSQLPTLPSVAVELLELSKNPETEINDVVAVIKTDPAITAKILKATNSSFFGFSSKVTSIDRAVPLLGTTVVTSLALSFSLVEAAMTSGPLAQHYKSYWMQSVVHAATAEILAGYSQGGLDCEFFLAGLLMDIGRLAMLKTISDEYLPILELARDQQRGLAEVETEQLGFNHAEIGCKLMENWELPEVLINTVQLHHAPLEKLLEQSDSPDFELIKASAVTAAVGDYFCGTNKGPALERLRSLSENFYDFDESKIEEFLNKAKVRIDEAGELFSANTAELGDPGDLMALANEHLAQLAMKEHVASTQAVAQQKKAEQEKEELVSENKELQQKALRDPLTKLYNRHFFDEALSKEINRCCRAASSIGLIFTDIDRFKQLNDTYGHQFGDLVLQRIAQVFGKALRSSDVLARFGGEEFVILANQPTEKGLEKLAERIRAHVEAVEILFEDKRVPVTVSIGAVITIPGRKESDLAQKLVAAADEEMYKSKENGRNQVYIRSLMNDSQRRLLQAVMQNRFSRWLVNRRIFDIPTISKALLQCRVDRVPIGELAQRHGHLDPVQVDSILQDQEISGHRFGEIAMRLGLLSEQQLVYLLVLQQEDPLMLGRVLTQLQLLEQSQVALLLKEYLAENTPQRQASTVPDYSQTTT